MVLGHSTQPSGTDFINLMPYASALLLAGWVVIAFIVVNSPFFCLFRLFVLYMEIYFILLLTENAFFRTVDTNFSSYFLLF
jgi:hypothetical protein